MASPEPAVGRKMTIPAESGIAAVLLVVLVAGYLATPNFLTVSNILILLLNGAVIGFLCLGQTFVLLTGGIDLSCGSVTALTCVLAALLMETVGLDWQSAVVLSLMANCVDRRDKRLSHRQYRRPGIHRHFRNDGRGRIDPADHHRPSRFASQMG